MASDRAAASGVDVACQDMVCRLVHMFADVWWAGGADLPDLGRTYTPGEQVAREAVLERFQQRLIVEMECPPATRSDLTALQSRLLPDVYQTLLPAFDIDAGSIDASLVRGLVQEAARFARSARRFDPAIAVDDIYQASRNVWTMFALQHLMGAPVALTPSVLAYGLLYPYTDNYLDDPAIAKAATMAFIGRLGRCLCGEEVPAANEREQRIFDLVAMIDSQYPHGQYPQVRASLCAIHNAQIKGMQLLGGGGAPFAADVLGITLEKGGASVLTDGYLVAGDVSNEQAAFLFGWGALMQLVDDMQDVAQDGRDGAMSLYTLTAGNVAGGPRRASPWAHPVHWPLDALANRSFHFAFAVMDRLDVFAQAAAQPLTRLMKQAVIVLMASAIVGARSFYSPGYVAVMERYLPLRPGAILKHGRFSRRQATLRRLLESFASSEEGRVLAEEVLA